MRNKKWRERKRERQDDHATRDKKRKYVKSVKGEEVTVHCYIQLIVKAGMNIDCFQVLINQSSIH